MKSKKRPKLPPVYIRIALIVVVFGALGTYLLTLGKAEPETVPDSNILSLMPAEIALNQNEIVNVAVNLEPVTSTNTAKAVIRYPADSLELQAVHDVCLSAGLEPVGDGRQTSPGQVTVECASKAGVTKRSTLAILVFKGLGNNGDAQLSISDGSIITGDNGSMEQRVVPEGSREIIKSHVRLQPTTTQMQSKPKIKRDVPRRKSKPVCDQPAPGQAACLLRQVLNDDGSPVTGSPSTSTSVAEAADPYMTPDKFHAAYRLPCRPGGPVQSRCAQPASFGPELIVITILAGYVGGPDQLESDLTAFSQYFGIPTCTRANGCLNIVNAQGETSPLPAENDSWSSELSLDVDAVHEICQTCKITVVMETDGQKANIYAASLKPVAISNSWVYHSYGIAPSAEEEEAYNQPGIAQLFGTGDWGTDIADEVARPADMASTIAVSGTELQLNTDNTWAGEKLWSSAAGSDGKYYGTGGSCSTAVDAPSWQKALPNWSGVGCGDKRAYGDIALDGSPNSGAWTYFQGKWRVNAGTSLSTPLLAGMYGLSGQGVIPDGKLAGEILYSHANSSNTHDITSGNNCTPEGRTVCNTKPGFDVPSGFGSLNGLTAIGGPVAPPPPPPPPPTTPPPTTPPPTTPPPTTPPPTTPPPGGNPKPADINGSGKVDLTDLSILLSNWNKDTANADLNSSGKVDLTDLSMLLSKWGA